ncbi:MAG: hypothetical protein Q7T55_25965 [Solirubrobacteraceae bacterium]|nr:hypothetical protein [Solirubrobacteraceae bacterium]
MGRRRPRSWVAAVFLVALLAGAVPSARAADLGERRSGPNAIALSCGGRWAPIQAKVSGFVVGNCRGGTPVLGAATDACAPGCVRGARNEGRAWEAVALPPGAHFAGCGWINVQNRLGGPAGAPPPDRCGRVEGPDLALPQRYVKRFSGRSVGGAPKPRTEKYRGLYLWAGRFTSGANRGQEGGAIAYRPRFTSDPRKTCTAYANVNPGFPGQRVRSSERMWSVHDRSAQLQIRYVARFQARNEQGHLRWWVNAHSTAPSDRDQPWGFISAECLFDVAPGDPDPFPPTEAPAAATPALARYLRPAPPSTGPKCGFAPVAFHTIVARRGLTCAEAKAALRKLKGSHDLAPMACGRPRRLGGWRLRNLVRDPSLAITRYRRNGRSFDFQRHQFPGNIWCPAPR